MKGDGALDLARVPTVCDCVLGQGVSGLFLCGSTFNFMGPYYRRVIDALAAGDLERDFCKPEHGAVLENV